MICSGLAPAAARALRKLRRTLVRLSSEVSFPDDMALGVNRILSANVDCSCRSCNGDYLCKSRIFMQSLRVEMCDFAVDGTFFWILGHRCCLSFLNACGCVPHCCSILPSLARPSRALRPGCRAGRERGSVGPRVPAHGAWCTIRVRNSSRSLLRARGKCTADALARLTTR